MENFIEQLEQLDGNIDKSLDFMFNTVDDYLIEHNFSKVDDLILQFVESNKSFNLYVSFLTITGRYRDRLKNRNILFEKSKEVGKEIMLVEDIKFTLTGL